MKFKTHYLWKKSRKIIQETNKQTNGCYYLYLILTSINLLIQLTIVFNLMFGGHNIIASMRKSRYVGI